jgi:hypothetical protein
MRKLLTSLLVTLGIAELVRRLRRRGKQEKPSVAATRPEAAVEPSAGEESAGDETAVDEVAGEGPEDELRRKIAETRAEDRGTAAASADEPPVDASPAGASSAGETVEERRSSVYEQGRSALDEMQESSER